MAERSGGRAAAMTGVVVRPFVEADVEASFGVWRRAWESALPGLDVAALLPDWRRDFLEHQFRRQVVLAADLEGALAGFAIVDPARGWLDQLVVDPACHRRGIGRSLIRAVLALSPERLAFRVVQSNAGALAFYDSLGFVRLDATVSPTSGWESWNYAWPGGHLP